MKEKPVYLYETPLRKRIADFFGKPGNAIFCLWLLAIGIFAGFKIYQLETATDKATVTQSSDNFAQGCEMLAIAFDEAQLPAAWYLQAADVLKQCGKAITADDITSKVCHANKWNGIETKECEAFEESSQ